MWSHETCRAGARARWGLTLLLVLLAAPAVVAAAEAESPFLEELESSFRVLRLRDGWVLEPKTDLGGIDTIELSGGIWAIDGEPVTEAELTSRLGDAANLVLRLGALDDAEREALLEAPSTGAMEISEPGEAPEPERSRERPRRPRRPARSDDAEVVFGSDLEVEAGEVSRDVVVFGGELRVDGEVRGDAVAIGGSAMINGEVEGDVAVIGGEAEIGPNAVIHGDLVNVGGEIDLDENAVLHGRMVEVPFGPSIRFGWPRDHDDWRWSAHDWFSYRPVRRVGDFVWEIFGLVVLGLLACLALMIARQPVDRIARRARLEPWKSGLVGLLSQLLFGPLLLLVVIILAVSIIGIPLLLLVPFALLALVLVAFLGYTAVAFRVGSWASERFGWRLSGPFKALLAGIVILQVWSLFGEALDMVGGPVQVVASVFLLFGGLVLYVTWTVGFGAAVLTRFGTAEGWQRRGALPPPAAPVPPGSQEEAPPPAYEAPEESGEAFWEREEGSAEEGSAEEEEEGR